MDIRGWINNSKQNIRTNGVMGVKDSMWPVYRKILEQGRRFQPYGDNIYDFDWDLLIIVDACRLDLMKEVSTEYDYIEDVNSIWSVDSTTAYWMKRTFSATEESTKTAYICGNPFSEEILVPEEFDRLHEVWRDVWDEPGTVPPRAITDATIETMQSQNPNRTIAHYMQPHCPFIPQPNLSKGKQLGKFGNQDNKDVWELLQDGELSRQEVWEGYRKNLELVLKDIRLLLQSVDADEVVITSDHGNAIGELGIYGHPPQMPHKCLREVPWIKTTATNLGDYSPETSFEKEHNVNREEQLKALGYT